MSSAPIIVNYQQIVDGFGCGTEAVAKLSGPPGRDDLEAAMFAATMQRALDALHEAQVVPDVMTSPDDPVAAALQTVLSENAHNLGVPTQIPAGGRELRLGDFDPRWAKSLVGLIKMHLNVGKFDFREGPTTGDPIPDQARIGILGDWGTNLYGAPHCAEAIKDDGNFNALIHLGDVYYTGSKSEVEGRFLAEWPFLRNVVNRACNSNHEMFSGGVPYAQQTLTRFKQPSSLFWLENKHWVLLGLDTAYVDGELGPLQVDWMTTVCAKAADEKKRVLLFSHHQPWRTDNGEEQPLVKPIRKVLGENRVAGWYWGHEHLCSLFEAHPKWEMWGACIGHSGFPYVRLSDAKDERWERVGDPVADNGAWHKIPARRTVAGVLLDGPNRWIENHEDKFGPNGYAVLELDGEHLRELIFTPSGEQIHERALA